MQSVALGLTNKEIAQKLNLATYTIKSHVHNILEKLPLYARLHVTTHTKETFKTNPDNTLKERLVSHCKEFPAQTDQGFFSNFLGIHLVAFSGFETYIIQPCKNLSEV